MKWAKIWKNWNFGRQKSEEIISKNVAFLAFEVIVQPLVCTVPTVHYLSDYFPIFSLLCILMTRVCIEKKNLNWLQWRTDVCVAFVMGMGAFNQDVFKFREWGLIRTDTLQQMQMSIFFNTDYMILVRLIVMHVWIHYVSILYL